MAYAHSKNHAGVRHDLVAHLREVADLAYEFAKPFEASELASYLGLWHDVGKFHPEWQDYLIQVEQGSTKKGGPDHKAAGAKMAADLRLGLLALIIQGHHGGLHNAADLAGWLTEKMQRAPVALALANQSLPNLLPSQPLALPIFLRQSGLSKTEQFHRAEFFTRMLFSALVDADFLSTEQHFNNVQTGRRSVAVDIPELWERFMRNQRNLVDRSQPTPVNQVRQEMYTECLAHARDARGLFRLTMPTGGGKTRATLAFGLQHARHHGQQRIIIAVPFTTITTQTAALCREIFDDPHDSHSPVLEHYSAAAWQSNDPDENDPEAAWQRLASENWDAPIIVTTTVQLFESLFANSTAACRKLHRLANSVIILDEVQSLPTHVLDPILAGLRELTQHYGASVVLSTATQPTFDLLQPFQDLPATDLIASPLPYFQQLTRVTFDRSYLVAPLPWSDLARHIMDEPQVLVIVNTKQDALDLVRLLPAVDHRFHLSTTLCGAHRQAVLATIRARLTANQPCWLITTQLVEAGVDIDFPIVWRALSPLESIVQAAGRCNREGRLAHPGRVLVFRSEGDHLPPGFYTTATNQTRTILAHNPPPRLDDLDLLRQYFEQLYPLVSTDSEQIQSAREQRAFQIISKHFKLIKQETISVIVRYGTDQQKKQIDAWCEQLRLSWAPHRSILRQLQPYMVTLYQHQAKRFHHWLEPIDSRHADRLSLVQRWTGHYDPAFGLVGEDLPIDDLIL